MIQRSASLSYTIVPSPSSLVWQPPPKPLQSVFVGTGPYTGVPDLLKTAKLWLTISTKWFGPTAPFGSGGADVTVKLPFGPLKPWPTPSKPTPTGGALSMPGVVCTTGSGTALCAGTGSPFFGSFS